MPKDMIRDFTKEMINPLKRQKMLKAIIVAVLCIAVCMGWNIVRNHRLQPSLQDVYFTELGDVGTHIYKCDVTKGKKVAVAVLKGGWYSDCMINRTENYIIGEFYHFRTKTRVLLRYNLSDNTTEEITGKEAEVMEERIKEAKDKLPERSSLPEEVRNIVYNYPIYWSADGKIAAFSDSRQEKIYLYDANTETCECILEAGWNQTFGSNLGLDVNGRYLFYQSNFNYFFQTADVKIMMYDLQTGEETKIHTRRYTQNDFEFVQEMN